MRIKLVALLLLLLLLTTTAVMKMTIKQKLVTRAEAWFIHPPPLVATICNTTNSYHPPSL